jgi:hypothetical protein
VLAVTLGAEYAVGDIVTLDFSGSALIDSSVPTSAVAAVNAAPCVCNGITLGLLSSDADQVAYRVIDVQAGITNTTNGVVVTFAAADTIEFSALAVRAAAGVTVSYSAATDTGIPLDTGGGDLREVEYIQVFGIGTETYSWTGTVVSVEVDNGTGVYAGTQVGDTFSGRFTYDTDVANIDGLDTSDGDSVIEPGDTWVEYFLGSDSATLTDGTTQLNANNATLSITNDHPVDEPGQEDILSNLLGKEVAFGTLTDEWGLDFGDGNFEFAIAYFSLDTTMFDDLSFRPNPPWSPPGSPDDSDNQIAIFLITEFNASGVEVYSANGVVGPVSVPADDCTATAGGCNPTGGQEIVLPDNFVVPPGGVITQTPVSFVDPRADENGRCDGQNPLVLFDGDLTIPPEFCGSPEFEVLVTEANFEILEGTVESTMFPEVFVSNPLGCDRPIIGDPQLQDIVVWQPDNSADVIEGRALELTFDCGSSRGRTRRLSFFVVGMHIDFGIDFDQDPQAVTQAFIDLTSAKIDSLVQAVENAEKDKGKKKKKKEKKKKKKKKKKDDDFDKLRKEARDIQKKFEKGQYDKASRKLESFLKTAERAEFDTDIGFNHQGNLISRASNIKFTLDEKIIPFAN